VNKEITAGSASTRIYFSLYDFDEALIDSSAITTLSYKITNITEDVTVRAETGIIPVVASGYILLEATDTTLQGTGNRETCRLCLLVDSLLWEGNTYYFDIVQRGCV